MKTALIIIEPLDDLASLTDKLAWAKAPRALLLWPKKGCGLTRSLDFVLLRRAADRLGTQIAIVTRRRQWAWLAAAAGIPVFPTKTAALKKAWRWRRVRPPRPRTPRADLFTLRAWASRPLPWERLGRWPRLAVFALGVLAVFVLLGFTLPSAQITLHPRSVRRSATVVAQVSPAFQRVTATGRLPGRWVEVTVGGELETAVHGHTALPQQPAVVTLRFRNMTDRALTLPAGTVVSSKTDAAVHFRTTEAVNLPPRVNATADAPALSTSRGEAANRPAHDLQRLDPPWAFQVAVDNPRAAHGGRDVRAPAASESDRRTLENRLQALLEAKARRALLARFPHGWLVWPSLQPVETLERAFTPADDTPTNRLTLRLRLRYRVLLVPDDAVRTLARLTLKARAPQGMTLWQPSVRITPAAPAAPPQAVLPFPWRLEIQGQFVAPLAVEKARRLAAGATRRAAAQRLQRALPLTAPPQITLSPRWWPRLPWLPTQISVTVRPQE